MRRSNYKGRRVARRKVKQNLVIAIIIIFVGLAMASWKGTEAYFKSHFAKDTVIQGVDCSYLNINKALNKIFDELSQQSITLAFENTQYEFCRKDFEVTISDVEQFKTSLLDILEFVQPQKGNKGGEYIFASFIKVSKEKTKEVLQTIPELQEENMVSPVDAYIKVQEDGTLAIESEVIGSTIDFDEAVSFCIECIEDGETTINFTDLIEMPEVLSTNESLNGRVNDINTILGAVINFEFADGSTYTLNKETTKEWVKVDEVGNYYVEMENVKAVVEELNKRVQDACEQITFTPTDLTTPMTLPGKLKVELDIEAEKVQIIKDLVDGGERTREPIYKDGLAPRDMLSYIEVDITRQMVWAYIDSELVLITPCVTGKPPRHDTPTGVYYLSYKTMGEDGKGVWLRGYNDNGTRYASWVQFWMPFNGGIGFHDANWQPTFGGDWYLNHGSHGCVNLPYEAAQTLYNYIDTHIPIIVYCS